jgi:hypothetical protein
MSSHDRTAMSLIHRAWHRVALLYQLACARDDRRRQHLPVPSGIWFCAHCQRVLWDLDTFVGHNREHTGFS